MQTKNKILDRPNLIDKKIGHFIIKDQDDDINNDNGTIQFS